MSGPRYAIIPREAVLDNRLQGRDLQVLCVLGSHTDDGGWAIRSQVKISAAIGCARSTVQASMKRLVDAGYVEIHSNQRRDGGDASNWYRVRLDVQAAPLAETELYVGDVTCEPVADEAESDADTPCRQVGTPAGIPAPLPIHGSAGVPIHGSAPLTRVSTGDSTTPPKTPKGVREARLEDGEEGFNRFFEAWTGSDPGLKFDPRGAAFGAWKRLTPDERQAASNQTTISAVIAGQRRAKRTSLMGAARYLREKAFERVEAAPSATGPVELVPLAVFGRTWWYRFYEMAKGGGRSPSAGKAKFMAQQAERGQGVAVPLAEAQTLEVAATSFVYVMVGSPEFVEWREWFATRGMQLPRPAKADRIWMPSQTPPANADVSSDEAEGDRR